MEQITGRIVRGIQIRQGDNVQAFPANLYPVYQINDLTTTTHDDCDDDDLYFNDDLPHGDYILFMFDDGRPWALLGHQQECCEDVYLSEWCGDWEDLIGQRIEADERTSAIPESEESDSVGQWTFYCFRTLNGSVTATWRGSSNGYYSTGVSLIAVELLW